MAHPADQDLLGHSLESILDETAAPGQPLAAGSAAALSVALAAALTRSVARAGDEDDETAGAAVQAEALRLRATELVERNRSEYAAALEALAARVNDPGHRDVRIGAALEETLAVLERIAGTGADVGELAAHLAAAAPAQFRPDAASAAILAESGARIACELIEANLLGVEGSSARTVAAAHLDAAASARELACAHSSAG